MTALPRPDDFARIGFDWRDEIAGLPAENAIRTGLADLQEGRTSVEGLLVAVAASELRWLGLPVPDSRALPADPELALHTLLGAQGALDPYSRYNALRRELTSFTRALERRVYARRRAR